MEKSIFDLYSQKKNCETKTINSVKELCDFLNELPTEWLSIRGWHENDCTYSVVVLSKIQYEKFEHEICWKKYRKNPKSISNWGLYGIKNEMSLTTEKGSRFTIVGDNQKPCLKISVSPKNVNNLELKYPKKYLFDVKF